MITRDYIMRMIQMLATVLAKILFHRDLKQYGDAMQELDKASQGLLGLTGELLLSLSDRQLLELFGREDQRDKLLAASELLREASEILREQGKQQEGFAQGMKAFSLFVELIEAERDYLKVTSADKFALLVQYLEEYELPISLEKKRFRYYDIVGQYGAAEQVLRELLDKDPGFREQGVAFYEKLLGKPDAELQEGGLPREKIRQGVARIRGIGEGTRGGS